MPESFKAAGYQTAMVGKWHLSHSQEIFHPNARGFDNFYGHMHTEVGYFPPFANQGGIDFQRNGETISDEGYETFLWQMKPLDGLKQGTRNLFLYVPFIAPPYTDSSGPSSKYKNLEDIRAYKKRCN